MRLRKILQLLIMAGAFASPIVKADNHVDVVRCLSTMNSSTVPVELSFPLTPFTLNGHWETTETSNYGASYYTKITVSNGVFHEIHLGYSDGEGGLNRSSAPLKRAAGLAFSEELKIACALNPDQKQLRKLFRSL